MLFRKTKNRNIPKINKSNQITLIQILLFPICSLWVNMLFVISLLKNSVLIAMILIFIYVNENFFDYTLMGDILGLLISLSGVIFLINSVYPSKNKIDRLETFLKTVTTPVVFMKFKYAKRNTRLQVKQVSYLKRIRKTKKQHE